MTEKIQGHFGIAQLDGTAISKGAGVVDSGCQRVSLPTDQTVPVSQAAATTGGYTPGKLISANTTNATVIKASAGTLGSLTLFNTNAAAMYVKFYNKATAPTVGTDPPVATYLIPGGTAGAGVCVPLPSQGLAFSAGISFATTTGIADSDTAAVAANEIIVNYGYK